jgi:hypothetical protein
MKNNAIQHAATLVNNEEGMIATGVKASSINEKDIYMKVAVRVIE